VLGAWSILAGLLGTTAIASAEAPGDGLYHRWDAGDLMLALGAGGGVASPEVGPAQALATLELRARVLDLAGPFVVYRAAPSTAFEHALLVGVEIRPFFPALLFTGASTGQEWVDLFVESIGVDLGGAFRLDGELRASLVVGITIELPLLLPSRSPTRVGLRLEARRIDARRSFRNVDSAVDRSAWDAVATVVVAFPVRVGIAARARRLDR
jgi:hypothetical protein